MLPPVFFQASLLPYLLFLFFLSRPQSRTPDLANFGFQFVLVFVLGTILAGVLAQNLFDSSLANVDWLHGSAESLLTIANVLIVIGFKDAMRPSSQTFFDSKARPAAWAATAFLLAFVVTGTFLHFQRHSQFLFGIGNYWDSPEHLFWATRAEPVNALSIPTWTIHFLSVFEYLVAMKLVWIYGGVTSNLTWRGLTWGMLPMHASSICAVTHHLTYNKVELESLVATQGIFTLLGNTTTMIAAFRIARHNGWTLSHNTSDETNAITQSPSNVLQTSSETSNESNSVLMAKLVGFTLVVSYGVKYGELAWEVANATAAWSIVLAVPTVTASYFMFLSIREGCQEGSIDNDGEKEDYRLGQAPDEETPLV